ncbi:MAG: PIN domain-containing protein [Candidatus Zixiibacteriota bacterium]
MRLVIDSNIFVSSLDPEDIFHTESHPILHKILTLEIEDFWFALVLVEVVCVLRQRTNSENLVNAVYKNLSHLPAINWLDTTLEVAQRASLLNAKTGRKGGDPIGLQVAEQYESPLLPKDKQITQKVQKEILVFEPLELSPSYGNID